MPRKNSKWFFPLPPTLNWWGTTIAAAQLGTLPGASRTRLKFSTNPYKD